MVAVDNANAFMAVLHLENLVSGCSLLPDTKIVEINPYISLNFYIFYII